MSSPHSVSCPILLSCSSVGICPTCSNAIKSLLPFLVFLPSVGKEPTEPIVKPTVKSLNCLCYFIWTLMHSYNVTMKLLIPILFLLSIAFLQPACVHTEIITVTVCDSTRMQAYFDECLKETIHDIDGVFIKKLRTKNCKTNAHNMWCKEKQATVSTRRGRVIKITYL